MKRVFIIAQSLAIGLAAMPLLATASGDHGAPHSSHGKAKPTAAAAQTKAGSAAMTEGEIRKVDKDAGKITIRHAELKNLGMPPMTMVFQLKDKAMLAQVKAGDRINFVADKIDGKLTVMQLEAKE